MPVKSALYDEDFYAWSNQQAALLRAGRFSAADVERIAEEIESMGKTEKRELVSRLKILLLHLLKWQFQPRRRGASGQASIRIQRLELAAHLVDNPSLKATIAASMAAAYSIAIIAAAQETALPEAVFPVESPYVLAQLMDRDFWPE